jgi:hypothetical protein
MLQTIAKVSVLWRMTPARHFRNRYGPSVIARPYLESNQTHGKEHREAGNIPPYLDLGQLDSRYPLP